MCVKIKCMHFLYKNLYKSERHLNTRGVYVFFVERFRLRSSAVGNLSWCVLKATSGSFIVKSSTWAAAFTYGIQNVTLFHIV